MKKIFFAIPFMALAMTACNPSDIEGGSEWAAITADQIQVTATPAQVDGKNGNVIHVVSASPVVTAWDAPQLIENTTHTVTTEGDIYVTRLGTNTITLSATNTGGAPVTKEITVQVDTISYITDAIKNRLCIGKTGAPDHFGIGFDVSKVIIEQETTEDGTPGNKIKVTSNINPTLCTFKWGSGTMDTNIGDLITYDLGDDMDLTLEVLQADGSIKNFNLGKFSAKEYTFFPKEITLLTGYHPTESPTATKTWTLVDENNWGNGGNNDQKPSWWTTTVNGQGGSNGTITFDFANSTLTKVIFDESNKAGDKGGSGAFKLDFASANASANILFRLNTTEPGNIIYPIMINQGDYHPTVYDVTLLTEKDLILRAQHTNDNTWEGCFWVFKAVPEDKK